jgi:hypothetical protein
MFEPSLQSRNWPNLASAWVVLQAALLFKEMSRRLCDRSTKTVNPGAQRFDLLWVALRATACPEVDASGHPYKGALTTTRYDGGSSNGPESFRRARRAQMAPRFTSRRLKLSPLAWRRRVPAYAHYNEPSGICHPPGR